MRNHRIKAFRAALISILPFLQTSQAQSASATSTWGEPFIVDGASTTSTWGRPFTVAGSATSSTQNLIVSSSMSTSAMNMATGSLESSTAKQSLSTSAGAKVSSDTVTHITGKLAPTATVTSAETTGAASNLQSPPMQMGVMGALAGFVGVVLV